MSGQIQGPASDQFAVRTTEKGGRRIRFTYFVGGVDVSAQIRSGAFRFHAAPSDRYLITVRATIGPDALSYAQRSADLRVTSVADPSMVDVVRAVAARN